MEYLKGNETRLKPIKHIKDKRLNNAHIRMFNSNELIDFVNWHLKVCKVDERHELENLELIASFLDGNKPEEWHRKPELTNTSKTAKKLNNGLCHVVRLSLLDIETAANKALELTKLPPNSKTTERELELGRKAYINGAIWAKNKYEGNEA